MIVSAWQDDSVHLSLIARYTHTLYVSPNTGTTLDHVLGIIEFLAKKKHLFLHFPGSEHSVESALSFHIQEFGKTADRLTIERHVHFVDTTIALQLKSSGVASVMMICDTAFDALLLVVADSEHKGASSNGHVGAALIASPDCECVASLLWVIQSRTIALIHQVSKEKEKEENTNLCSICPPDEEQEIAH